MTALLLGLGFRAKPFSIVLGRWKLARSYNLKLKKLLQRIDRCLQSSMMAEGVIGLAGTELEKTMCYNWIDALGEKARQLHIKPCRSIPDCVEIATECHLLLTQS
jgi:hypothetical protein